jgi:hypothetical protein
MTQIFKLISNNIKYLVFLFKKTFSKEILLILILQMTLTLMIMRVITKIKIFCKLLLKNIFIKKKEKNIQKINTELLTINCSDCKNHSSLITTASPIIFSSCSDCSNSSKSHEHLSSNANSKYKKKSKKKSKKKLRKNYDSDTKLNMKKINKILRHYNLD